MQKALDLRSRLLAAQEYRFSMDAAADFGETVFRFSVDCEREENGVECMIAAPESICGVKTFRSDDGASILFDDVRVSLGSLANGNLAPLESPWLLCRAMEEAYISCTGREENCIRVTYLMGYGDQELQLDVWLDELTNMPRNAEFTYEGRSVLRAAVTKFEI